MEKEKDNDKKHQYLLASVNELEKGVGLIEDYAEAWYHLGVAYKELDDAANSIRAFEKCRSYKPIDLVIFELPLPLPENKNGLSGL